MALEEALGRVLAEEVVAAEAVPGFDNSAMDGYAIRAADVAGADAGRPASLRLVGESRAGHPAQATLAAGEAIAISTGAMVPEGADAVVRVEDTERRDGRVEVRVPVAGGRQHPPRRRGRRGRGPDPRARAADRPGGAGGDLLGAAVAGRVRAWRRGCASSSPAMS